MKHSINISSVAAVATSHGCGLKRVLFSSDQTSSAITQIAVTRLRQGDVVESHSHPTMEEFFLIRSGKVAINIGGVGEELCSDDFIRIAAGTEHDMKALTDCELLTIGCAL